MTPSNIRFYILYNQNIDILSCPKDPREASKIESRYIPLIFDLAKKEYDVVLVDTSHILDEINLTVLDYSYMSLFVITNDLVDLKNMRSLLSIFKDTGKKNYLIVLKSIKIGCKFGKLFVFLHQNKKI